MSFSLKTNFLPALLGLAILGLGLSGCGSIVDTGQDMVPDSIYDLEALPKSAAEKEVISVFMEPPTFPAYLKTFKIAVKPGGQEIQYLAEARWSDQAPQLIERFLMVSLENTGSFLVISSRKSTLPHDYRLVVDIRDFSAHAETAGPPLAVVDLEISLLEEETFEVLAKRNFVNSVTASENSKAAIAAAFQNAMERIARDLETWILSVT